MFLNMSFVRIGIVAVLLLCNHNTNAQFPGFMDGFMNGMNTMVRNLQTMGRNLASMGNSIYSENMARARAATANLRPGQRQYFDDGNVRGFAYRSRDGGFTSYSFSSGGPGSHGYMYYSGPDGTYERSW